MTIKSIQLSLRTWLKVYNQLAKDYSPSVLIIRDKMRRTLGFTVRRYQQGDPSMVSYYESIFLDFYDEKKKSMFLLRFSHLLTDIIK